MKDTLRIRALRDCHVRLKWTDDHNQTIKDEWVHMAAGESRDDAQFVMALDPDLSDMPTEFDYLIGAGLQDVFHPHETGSTEVSYEVLVLTKLG